MTDKQQTPTYREAHRRAFNVACLFQREQVIPCHLFSAVVGMANSQQKSIMREIMDGIGVDSADLYEQIMEDAKQLGKLSSEFAKPVESDAYMRICASSESISRSMNHGWLGVEHIFLALVKSNAIGVGKHFRRLDITYSKASKAIQTILAPNVSKNPSDNTKGAKKNVFGGAGKQKQKKSEFQFEDLGTDMTAMAMAGKIDGAGCREDIVEEMVMVLGRKTKSCPILLGEPGVGKTACVEELAIAISRGDVMNGERLFSCEMGKLVAGTKLRGQFEERLKEMLKWAESENVVVFIDEAHTMVAAGGGDGSINVSNILKPYLARDGRFIFATTREEYRKYIEKDAALQRRMAVIDVPELPVPAAAKAILSKISLYETHHKVSVAAEHVFVAAQLAKRYMPSRRLPDSALDLLDESMAAVSIRKGTSLSEWDLKKTVESIFGAKIEDNDRAANAEKMISEKVFGQDDAVRSVVSAWKRRSAGISDARRPIASFLFAGESGCGMTTLAEAVAAVCFENRIMTIDMSEMQSDADISKIIGAPPGYVGYESGGKLVNYVRRNPNCVIVLDKIHLASTKVLNILLQALEEGQITDGHGKVARLNDAMVIMTASMKGSKSKSVGFHASEETAPSFDARKLLSPELVNRIDEVVQFRRLTAEDLETMARSIVDAAVSRTTAKIEVSESVFKLISSACKNGMDIRKTVDRDIIDEASMLIIAGESSISVTVEENRISVKPKQ